MAVNFELADEEPGMSDRDEIVELLQRRDAVQGWLDRLEEQRGSANPKVLERVRLDYESRLREALDALGTYRDAIAQELAAARERLEVAVQARERAAEQLEEAALRHRIGELSGDEWEARRQELESSVEDAQRLERESLTDVGRLRDLLDQLDDRGAPVEETGPIDDLDAILLTEPELEPETASGPEASADAPAFLADIDRALALDADEEPHETAAEPGTTSSAGEEETEAENTAPRPGLKCPECGYTNDIAAWFCGVCGADIG